MRAVLYKDWVTGKTLLVPIVILCGLFAVVTKEASALPFILAFISGMVTASSFTIERQSEFSKFIFTTPVSRETYVRGKYLFIALCAVIALVSTLIIFYSRYQDLKYVLLLSSVAFATPIILNVIQIPLILEFGVEKGPVIILVICGCFVLLLFAAMKVSGPGFVYMVLELFQKMSQLDCYVICGLTFAIAMFILVIAQRISVAIIKRKEY